MVDFVIGAILLSFVVAMLAFLFGTLITDSLIIGGMYGVTIFTLVLVLLLCLDTTKPMDYRCEKANISYEMVTTTADITGEDIDDIFKTFVKYQDCGLEPFNAIKSIAPTLSDDEIYAIMEAAAIKEQIKENKGQD